MFLTILLSLILVACSSDSFEQKGIQLRIIIQETNGLLTVSSQENITNEKGDIVSTRVKFDKNKSREYLKSKKQDLDKIYFELQKQIKQSGEKQTDSIYLLVLINEFSYFIEGKRRENTCNYLKEIEENSTKAPSAWLVENVFGPLFASPKAVNSWKQLTDEQKIDSIKNYLLMSYNTSCN